MLIPGCLAVLIQFATFAALIAGVAYRDRSPPNCILQFKDRLSVIVVFVAGVFVAIIGMSLIYAAAERSGYRRGVIAHAVGRVQADRVDHGETVEWVLTPAEKPKP